MEEIKKYKGSIPMAGGLYPASGGEYPLINTALIEKDSVSGQRLDKYLEEYPYPFIYIGTAANKEMLDSLLPETEDSDNRSFIAFNKGEQVYYARSPITKEWTICSASISEIANSVEGASLIGIGDDVNEFIDISSIKAYINTGEENNEYQLIEKQDLMSDDTFSKEEKSKIKSALGVIGIEDIAQELGDSEKMVTSQKMVSEAIAASSSIEVSETEPTGENVDIWINPNRGNPISVVTAEDIAQELGDDPEKVLSQKAVSEIAGYQNIVWKDGMYINSEGGEALIEGVSATERISIIPSSAIKVNIAIGDASICFYNENNKFVSALSAEDVPTNVPTIISVPNDAYYIRLSCLTAHRDTAYMYGIDLIGEILKNQQKNKTNEENVNLLEGKTEILNELTNDKYASFINKDTLVYNSFIYGSNDGIGQMITVQGDARTATDYIPVIGGQAYYLYIAAFDPRLYAFYDENKQFIKHAASTNSAPPITQPLIAPANAAYLRLTILENRIPDAWMGTSSALTMPYREYMPISVETISAVENPVHHIGREFSTFTKCLCIGDSLTEGVFNDIAGTNAGRTVSQYSYPSILQKLSGVDCTNLGNGGFTSIRWYDYHQNDDLSGHDCAIIMLGVNDGLLNTSEDDMITALNAIINKVKTENAGIKIFLSTLTTAYKHLNRWAEINEIIRGIANMTANVYLVDIAQYSEINRLSAYTNGHLTAIGYQKMAAEFMAYISNIIATKADDFKFIQFIGSDWADVDAVGI